jgi:serine/threonine protein phosphatase PrpC
MDTTVDHGGGMLRDRPLTMRRLGEDDLPTLTLREARAGDRYLLCTHGLSDPVDDRTIREALQIADTALCAYGLIERALRRGGTDNVTVVVADVVEVKGEGPDTVVV